MKKYIMALDQGTTSSRCILFNKNGKIESISQKQYKQIYPQPGWVEHDPMDIWNTQFSVAKEALKEVGATYENIEAIGITNQRETTIVWDRITGEPIYNAIVWQCRRTSEIINKIPKGMAKKIHKRTGLIPDAYFSASKIKWILDNVKGAKKAAKTGRLMFGTVDTWLMWKLSDGHIHATDYTNASRTMLFDIHKLKWDEEILDYFGIPKSMLPEVHPSGYNFGSTDPDAFGGPISICGVTGDQQSSLFGLCCFEKGDIKNTYGTGCFLLMNTGKEAVISKHGLLTTIAAGLDEKPNYALEGSVFMGGAVMQWMKDELKLFTKSSQSAKLAAEVEDTQEGYLVPSFTGLGAPHWNQDARGTMVGLTRGFNKNHFIRAGLESIAYQIYDVIMAMQADAEIELTSIKVDGGASQNDFLMQFQSDIVGCELARPKMVENTALGAAYLAGLSVGFWKDYDELKKNLKIGSEFKPNMKVEDREKKIIGWRRAVETAKLWTQLSV